MAGETEMDTIWEVNTLLGTGSHYFRNFEDAQIFADRFDKVEMRMVLVYTSVNWLKETDDAETA